MMDQMLSFQIMDELNQNPILKNMVSSLICNPFLIEKMIYILTILKYNTLVRNQVQSNLQVSPINYQRMNQNLMMNINPMLDPNYNIPNQNPMMNVNLMNKPKDSEDSQNPINYQGMNQNPMKMIDLMNNPKEISITFRQGGQNIHIIPKISIQFNINEKVSDLIEKYRIKSGDRDLSKKFIFNAENLNFSLTLEEAGLTNNSNVFVIKVNCIKVEEQK